MMRPVLLQEMSLQQAQLLMVILVDLVFHLLVVVELVVMMDRSVSHYSPHLAAQYTEVARLDRGSWSADLLHECSPGKL